MRKLVFLLTLLFTSVITAQELNCSIVINAAQTGRQNEQIFKTLEQSLNDFVNKTTWTDKVYKPQERISCGMVITITERDVDRFNASIQVQSSRPIYDSTYSSPVFNYNDKDFNFTYVEFQNLTLNPNQFDSNLVSVISYYVYIILGIDADSFQKNGGTEYYNKAKNIVNVAQGQNSKGWNPTDGQQNRYQLIDQLLSPTFKEYRNVMYAYHRSALDEMSKSPVRAKERLVLVLNQFKRMHAKRPNSFIQRIFFDAKSDEISQIFSEGPNVRITELVETLNRVSPNNNSKWSKIKF
ncbi:type IX secretion system protein PorD [Pseudofulvibacter geojedonensis]